MKNIIFSPVVIGLFFLFSGCISKDVSTSRTTQSESLFQLGSLKYNSNVPDVGTVELRTGVYYEASDFKGCVLYLEGLADSLMNHQKLFTALSQNGYRVISFDYMGQGGSEGTMNHTRIHDEIFPALEIGVEAKLVWSKFAEAEAVQGHNCSTSKKMVIGWSTGGLAAYRLAHDKWADSVALIAPGIHPKKFVGEASQSPGLMLELKQVITERTLTRNNFANESDPHIDPIKPVSPAVVPLFAGNLLATSIESRLWNISEDINGIVFLSGAEDTYVDADATKATLANRAPHFFVVQYNGALHEIDNEIPQVANDMIAKTVAFFNSHRP
ncbi:MAG: alpha/beta hydrolase [Pseudobdellovibrio sp.]